MFETHDPDENLDAGTSKDDRVRILKKWMDEGYQIEIGEYPSVCGITVTVGGATFVDTVPDFPSELLIANIGLAVGSGAATRLTDAERRLLRRYSFNARRRPK